AGRCRRRLSFALEHLPDVLRPFGQVGLGRDDARDRKSSVATRFGSLLVAGRSLGPCPSGIHELQKQCVCWLGLLRPELVHQPVEILIVVRGCGHASSVGGGVRGWGACRGAWRRTRRPDRLLPGDTFALLMRMLLVR